MKSDFFRYIGKHGLTLKTFVLVLNFVFTISFFSKAQAQNSLVITPYEGSLPASHVVYLAEFTEKHITDLEANPNGFIDYYLQESITREPPSPLDTLSNFLWHINDKNTLTIDSKTGLTWFYIDITNASDSKIDSLLDFSRFDGVGWVYRNPEGEVETATASYDSRLGGRTVFDRNFVIPIEIAAHSTERIFGYIYSVSTPREGAILAWNPESFRELRSKEFIIDGIYYGFLFSLVLFNLALYLTMKQISYLYAGAFQLCIGALLFLSSGYGPLLIFPNYVIYTIPSIGVLLICAAIFSGLCSISIFQMQHTNKLLYSIWKPLIALSILQIPIVFFTSVPSTVEANANNALLVLNFVVFVCTQVLHVYTLMHYWNRTAIAKYWFIATTLQLWALIAWQVSGAFGFSVVDIFGLGAQVFTAINGVILIWLVGYVVRSERQQRAIAQKEAFDTLRIVNDIQQSKTNFITTAGHDLRQPLEAVRLHINALRANASEETKKVLEKVLVNTKELSALLSSLMNLSKSNSQIDSSMSENFQLNDVLNNLRAELKPFAKQKGQTLKIPLTEFVVHTNKVGLTQILRNLLNNSIKFTKKGSIEVEVEGQVDKVEIRVVDSGCGIAKHDLKNIFIERFQSGEQAKAIESSMGLGLSIVDRLATAMHIEIEVESALEKGTTFRLRLPRSGASIVSNLQLTNPSSLSGIFVVILNDDIENGYELKKLLENWGAMALSWTDVDSALIHISKHRLEPDLIITNKHCYRQWESQREESDESDSRTGIGLSETFDLSSTKQTTPTIVLYPASNGTLSTEHSENTSDENGNLYWFEEPINPGVLRSFIQRMIVSAE